MYSVTHKGWLAYYWVLVSLGVCHKGGSALLCIQGIWT